MYIHKFLAWDAANSDYPLNIKIHGIYAFIIPLIDSFACNTNLSPMILTCPSKLENSFRESSNNIVFMSNHSNTKFIIFIGWFHASM